MMESGTTGWIWYSRSDGIVASFGVVERLDELETDDDATGNGVLPGQTIKSSGVVCPGRMVPGQRKYLQ